MAITAAIAAPNIITQARREKEREMIWRGQQYVRAIRLYHQKTGRFPTLLEDLYKPRNGVRFMRQAYKDPVNNVDGSWRLIYVAPNGQLIGSLREHPNAFFFGAPVPSSFSGALAASSSALDGSKSSFASQRQSFAQSVSSSDKSIASNTGSFSPQNPSDDGGASSQISKTSTDSNNADGTQATNASENRNAGGVTNVPAQGGDHSAGVAQANVASGDENSAAPAVPAQNAAGDQNTQNSDSGNGVLPSPDQPPSSTPASTPQPSTAKNGAAPDETGPTFGQTVIIGVGSKVNKKSIMRFQGEKNYLQFEFLWNQSNTALSLPSP